MLRRIVVAAAGLLALAPGVTQAQTRPDAGSTRLVASQSGYSAKTWTTQNGRLRCIGVEPLGASCGRAGRREGPLFITHVVAGDPPRLGAFVIAGVAGDGARKVRIRWSGGTKVLTPGRFGSYLAVLPARARLADTAIFVRYADHTTRASDYRHSSARSTPRRGSVEVERTVAQLGGDGPFGLLSWRTTSGQLCWFVGDLVGDRVGFRRGATFGEYPYNDGGSCTTPGTKRDPLTYGVTTGGGPTIVAGLAGAGVKVVTLELADGTRHALPLSNRRIFAAALDPAAKPVALTATLDDGSERTRPLPG